MRLTKKALLFKHKRNQTLEDNRKKEIEREDNMDRRNKTMKKIHLFLVLVMMLPMMVFSVKAQEPTGIESKIFSFLPEGNPVDYIVDPLEVIQPEEKEELAHKATFHQLAGKGIFLTIIYEAGELSDSELSDTLGALYTRWFEAESGVGVFFDVEGRRIRYFVIGQYEDLYTNNEDAFEKITNELEANVVEAGFSSYSILRHQKKLLDFLNTVKAKKDGKLSFIDEMGLFEGMEYSEAEKELNKANLLTTVFSKSSETGYQTLEEWIEDYQDTLRISDLFTDKLIMGVEFGKEQYVISYQGGSQQIKEIVEHEILPEVDKEVKEYGLVAGITKFYDLSAQRLLPLESTLGEKGSEQNSGNLEEVRAVQGFVKAAIIFMILLLVILVVIIVLTIFIARRKAKKNVQNFRPSNVYPQGNEVYPQASGQGMYHGVQQGNYQPNVQYGQAPLQGYPQQGNLQQNIPHMGQGNQMPPMYKDTMEIRQDGNSQYSQSVGGFNPNVSGGQGYQTPSGAWSTQTGQTGGWTSGAELSGNPASQNTEQSLFQSNNQQENYENSAYRQNSDMSKN